MNLIGWRLLITHILILIRQKYQLNEHNSHHGNFQPIFKNKIRRTILKMSNDQPMEIFT